MKKMGLLLVCMSLFLSACATQTLGTGTVIRELKLKNKEYAPKGNTDTGALIGAGTGATAGLMMGVAATIATFGLAAPMIPTLTVAGGAIGGTGGAAVGYGVDLHQQGNGLYDYVIKLDRSNENVLVQQYAVKNIPLGSRVKVLRYRSKLSIAPI